MISFDDSPTPSSRGPLETLISVFVISHTLGALLGFAKIASERSNPTLRLSMSNAATISMSFGVSPASVGFCNPTLLSEF